MPLSVYTAAVTQEMCGLYRIRDHLTGGALSLDPGILGVMQPGCSAPPLNSINLEKVTDG